MSVGCEAICGKLLILKAMEIPYGSGTWDVSTTMRSDIKRAIYWGTKWLAEQGADEAELVMSKEDWEAIMFSQEIVEHSRMMNACRLEAPTPESHFAPPTELYGIPLRIIDAAEYPQLISPIATVAFRDCIRR